MGIRVEIALGIAKKRVLGVAVRIALIIAVKPHWELQCEWQRELPSGSRIAGVPPKQQL